MSLPYLTTSGPPEDVERFKRQRKRLLVSFPSPTRLPVTEHRGHRRHDSLKSRPPQMMNGPLADPYWKSTTSGQIQQGVASSSSINPLIFNRFVGTSLLQKNIPDGLSAAETNQPVFHQPTPWLVPATYYSGGVWNLHP